MTGVSEVREGVVQVCSSLAIYFVFLLHLQYSPTGSVELGLTRCRALPGKYDRGRKSTELDDIDKEVSILIDHEI